MQVTVNVPGFEPATVLLVPIDSIGQYLRQYFYCRFDDDMRALSCESKVGADILALCQAAAIVIDSMGEQVERQAVIGAVATQCRVWMHG